MKAAELLNPAHPVHPTFVKWLNGKSPTKRQARKFLQQFTQFRPKPEPKKGLVGELIH